MRLRWWEALLFALVAVGAIALLLLPSKDSDEPVAPATQPGPSEPGEPDEPDKPDEPDQPDQPDEPDKPDEPDQPDQPDQPDEPDKPDEPDQPEPLVGDRVLAEARASGDARSAIRILEAAEEKPERVSALAALRFEIAKLGTALPADHPQRERVEAAQAAAAEHAKVFEERFAEARGAEELGPDLRILFADYPIEGWLDAFFAPANDADVPAIATSEDLPSQADLAAVSALRGWAARSPSLRGSLALALTQRYERADRPRARLRWLLRAFEAEPSRLETAEELLRGYISQQRLKEALAITGAVPAPVPEAIWRQRATIGGWLSQPSVEAEAWLKVPREKLEGGFRSRLLALLTWLGRSEEALPYAIDAARQPGDDRAYEPAVEIALQSGKVDLALELMLEAAAKSTAPRPWRERYVTVALLDLRYEAAISELDRLVEDFPDGRFESLPGKPAYASRLEELYKSRSMDDALVAHLERRIERSTDPERRKTYRAQLIDLYVTLGNPDRIRELLGTSLAESRTVGEFLAVYPTARAYGVEDAESLAITLLRAGDDTAEDRTRLYDTVSDRLDDDARRAILEFLLVRHPDYAPLRERLMAVLDRVDPVAAATLEEERARTRPGDVTAIRAWIERAGWAKDPAMAIRAREALRELAPDDTENLLQLGYLLGSVGRSDEAVRIWKDLLAEEGPESDAAGNLAESLLLAGRYDEALPLLEARARAEGASREARVRYADALQAAGRMDAALSERRALAEAPDATAQDRALYADLLLDAERYVEARELLQAALASEPDNGHLLLRLAQSYAWDGAHDSAEPLLRRRITSDVPDLTPDDRSDRTEAIFILGEIYWAMPKKNGARALFRRALARIEETPQPTRIERAIRAKILGRLNDVAGATQAYAELIAELPEDVDTRLDLVDTLLSLDRVREARQQYEAAREIAPEDRRVRRAGAALQMKEKRYEGAIRDLQALVDEGPRTSSLYADQGSALREGGRFRDAARAYANAIRAGAQGDWLKRGIRDLRFDLGPRASVIGSHRFAGDDEWSRVGAEGVYALCPCDRITLALKVEHAIYDGFTENGLGNPRDEFEIITPELKWRFNRRNEVFLAPEYYIGRKAGPDSGVRAGVRLLDNDPYGTVRIEARYDVLMEETGAAPALGGRKRGVAVEGYRELDDWFWVAGAASYDRLSVIVPGVGRKTDGWATWRAEIGRKFSEASPPFLSGRLVYSGTALLDDRSIAQVVPLGKRFDFLIGVLRAQRNWEQVVDATFEVIAGLDLRESGFVWGAEGRLRTDLWRNFGLELRAGYANQDRFQDGESAHVDLRIDVWF